MTEQEYAAFVRLQRTLAQTHLDATLAEWRALYWTPEQDPVLRENYLRRDRLRRRVVVDGYIGVAVTRPEQLIILSGIV